MTTRGVGGVASDATTDQVEYTGQMGVTYSSTMESAQPGAVPLGTVTGKTVARELFLLFSRVGIAKKILIDQGTCLMSQVLQEMCRLLQIGQVWMSVYHPQTDRLLKWFNKTLKGMFRKTIEEDGKDWDQLLPYLLFAIGEVPQSSTGFPPFELQYGRLPRGLLDLARDASEQEP